MQTRVTNTTTTQADPPAERVRVCDCVQLFIFDLDDADQPTLAAANSLLSQGEQARAQRLKNAQDRRRFVARCVFVRHALGRMLGIAPAAVRFEVGKFGKPELVTNDGQPHSSLRFNLSHSENLLALATTQICDVGVDLEIIRDDMELEDLIRTCLSPTERAQLCALPACQQPTAFCRLWTRKEAVAKASGNGIAMSPCDWRVGSGHADGRWKLHTFECQIGSQSAVVSLATGSNIRSKIDAN